MSFRCVKKSYRCGAFALTYNPVVRILSKTTTFTSFSNLHNFSFWHSRVLCIGWGLLKRWHFGNKGNERLNGLGNLIAKYFLQNNNTILTIIIYTELNAGCFGYLHVSTLTGVGETWSTPGTNLTFLRELWHFFCYCPSLARVMVSDIAFFMQSPQTI